jgi:DNA invertase Pin-like site-specific DNA recombinase
LAEFERDLIREHTDAGLEDDRASWRLTREVDAKKLATAKQSLADQNNNITTIGQMLCILRATFYRAVEQDSV